MSKNVNQNYSDIPSQSNHSIYFLKETKINQPIKQANNTNLNQMLEGFRKKFYIFLEGN